ncbi:MAG: GAF domain-containing protein [Actinomycetota bacterium]|nr:GAF domain-containing protein [Actinomycetota bacterium]
MNDRPRDVLHELAELAANLGPALTPARHLELLRSITSAAMSLFGAAACSLALLHEDQEELEFYVASGAGADEVVGMRVPLGQGIAGFVVSSGQPIAIEDVSRDPRFAAAFAAGTGYVPRSILAMPLETEREMLGVIEVLDRRTQGGGLEGSGEMEMLSLFADQAALAIENSRVFSDLGRALFEAAGLAADGRQLTEALEDVAATAPPPSAEMAELAALFNRLALVGPEERRLATRLVNEVVAFLGTRRWLR